MAGGTQWFDEIRYTLPTALAIAGAAITTTQFAHLVGAGTLNTINRGAALNATALQNDHVLLRPNGAVTVVIESAGGNILTPFGQAITLAAISDYALLRYNGTSWIVVDWSVAGYVAADFTIAAGAIGAAGQLRPQMNVRSSGGAGTADNLATINGGSAGEQIVLRGVGGGERITIVATGNIRVPGGKTLQIVGTSDFVALVFVTGGWQVVGWSTTTDAQIVMASVETANSAAVVNPAAQTFFTDQQQTIPLNRLVVGSRILIRAMVTKTLQGGADQSTYELQIGGVTVILIAQTAAATAAFYFEADLVVRTTGAPGSIEGWARVSETPLAGGTAALVRLVPLRTIAITTTVANIVRLGVTRSVDNGGNSSQQEMLELDIS